MARIGVGMMSALPRVSNWWLQHMVFPVQAVWQRRQRVGWRPIGEPIPARAGGVMVLARAPG